MRPFGLMLSLPREITPGVITLFSGGIGNIPAGWHLCDGTLGTVDLRDKFVVATGPTFAVGSEGGAFQHTHDYTGNAHAHPFSAGADLSDLGGKLFVTTGSPDTGTTDLSTVPLIYYSLAYIQFIGV